MASLNVVNLTIGLILLGLLAPIGLNALFNANTTGWSDSAISIWVILPVIVLVGVMLFFVPREGGGGT